MSLSEDRGERLAAVKAAIEGMPGATGGTPPSARGVTLYKVKAKMFAILEANKQTGVNLKCDPALIDILKSQYSGVGHRGHLDRRFWIYVNLDGDVPTGEIVRLIGHSYDQVRAGLTKAQRAELAALGT
jgi:predicted DNA-binding protein (MmcQ/YjbR family)